MTTSYTSLLGLALPVTGELSGTWGDTVNSYITQYLDSAVAGAQTISGSQTAVTLSVTNGSALTQVGSGATGSSQYQIINCTGNPASLLTITVPAASKVYLVLNSTSTSQSVKIVGAGPTTGVTVISGEKALVAWNGSDFVKVATAGGSGTFYDVTVTNSATLSYGTANGVLYLNGSKVATSGSALTFDGTSITFGGTSQRIYADMSNATFANRFAFQTSTANNITSVSALPNGTSTTAQYAAFNNSDPTNSAYGAIIATSTAIRVSSAITGTGTYIPLTFYTDGNEQMRLTSTGLGIGTSSPAYKLDVSGYGRFTNFVGIGGGPAGSIALSITPSTWNSSANIYGVSDQNAVYSPTGASTEIMSYRAYAGLSVGTNNVTNWYGFNSTLASKTGSGTLTNAYAFYAESPTAATNNWAFYANGSASSYFGGNIGLGVTPSAWYSTFRAFQFGASGSSVFGRSENNTAGMASNAYVDSVGNWKYIATNTASYYQQLNGSHAWYYAASGTAGNAISFTQAMTLDASGNLVIGDTSTTYKLDAYYAGSTTIARFRNGSGRGYVRMDGYDDMTLQFYRRGSSVGFIQTDSSGTEFYAGTTGAYPFVFFTNNTERARITSSGDVVIGGVSANGKFMVYDANASIRATAPSGPSIRMYAGTVALLETSTNDDLLIRTNSTECARFTTGGNLWVGTTTGANSKLYVDAGASSARLIIGYNATSVNYFDANTNIFRTGGSVETARIASDGTVYIGSTSTVNNARLSVTGDSTSALNSTFGAYTASTSFGGQFVYLKVNTAAGTGFNIIQGNNSGGECFKVAGNGNVANTNNSYGALSDVKLKENIVDATPKLADLMEVKVRNYNLKSYPEHKQLGVIAQELEQVFPSMVDETPDRDEEGNDLGTTTKSVKYSVFVPMLIKAIQELKAEVDSLKSQLKGA